MTTSDGGAGDARAETAYAAIYGGLFMSLGANIAFLPLWMQDWGLSLEQVGFALSLAIAPRIAAGLLAPALSDRLSAPRAMMAAMAALGVLAAAALAFASGAVQVYALAALLGVSYAALIPLAEAHGYADAARRGFSYRRARSVGSMTFLTATWLCGVSVAWAGAGATLWWIGLPFAFVAIGIAAAPLDRADPPPAPSRSLRAGAGADWFWTPAFLIFLAAIAATHASHAVYYAYGALHWRALGYHEDLIGILFSWAVIAEIGVFFMGGRLMGALGPARALALAAAAATLRWGAMTLDPPLAAVFALQSLHGLSFGLAHLATLAFVQRAAPADRVATAQGLVSALGGGVAMLLATLAAAALYPVFAGVAYGVGAGLAALGVVAALLLVRREPQPQIAASGAKSREPS